MVYRQIEWRQWLLMALAILLAGAFAYLNSAERVSLHLGFAVLFRVPLAALLFVAFLTGMVTMFLFGIRHDRQVRRVLREYQIQQESRPWRPEPPRDAPL